MAFEVFADGEKEPVVKVEVQVLDRDSYRMTVHVLASEAGGQATYRCDESICVTLPILGACRQVFRDPEMIRPYCILARKGPIEPGSIELGAPGEIAPVILQIPRDAHHEHYLIQGAAKLAETKEPWTDEDRRAGTLKSLHLSSDLDEEHHRLALVASVISATLDSRYG